MSTSTAAHRIERVRAGVTELGLDGLLVSSLSNVRYLTGFSGSSGFLLLGPEQVVFATDGRYEQQAHEELADDVGFELLVAREGVLAALAERAGQGVAGATFGFEGQHVAYDQWQRIAEEADSLEWKSISGVVEKLRAVKDANEIAAMEKAAAIAAEALRATLPLVKPGVRETDIAAELDYRMVHLGAERPAFETIVASGARTALPHAATGTRRLERGELLLCDFGARWGGYCSDLTRTFVVGESSDLQRDRYGLVLEAQRAACGALTGGASGADVDAATRRVFEREGIEARFPHGTGHGVGLDVHESPRLGRTSEESLAESMVVTVEPGLYFPGWGGIRVEDDVVITNGQPRALVDLERDRLLSLPS
jgi:Xaa-Pro aminopeptidase